MIEKLDWDSAFFGYPVGRVFIQKTEGFNLKTFGKDLSTFKLVYMFSEDPLPQEYTNCLVDKKATFRKTISQHPDDFCVSVFDKEKDSYDELLDLVYLSGLYSRFKTDKNFQNQEFSRLYKEWINKSLNDTNTKVLVVRSGREFGGFVTLEMVDNVSAKIGLISVGEKHQGKGFGSILISYAERLAMASGRSVLKVVTQYENKPAVYLYEKNGFILESLIYIYHFWN